MKAESAHGRRLPAVVRWLALGLAGLALVPSAVAQEPAPPRRTEASEEGGPRAEDETPSPGPPEPARAGSDDDLFPDDDVVAGDDLFPDDDEVAADADDDLFPEDGDLDDLLGDDDDISMAEVVVTGAAEPEPEERATGGAVQRLDSEVLERFNYDNPGAVIQQVPGAYVRQEDGYGLRPNIGLRGVSSERSSRVTLMEDGILFGPAPYAAPAAYYFPMMTRMTGVDVYFGAAGIPYGPMTVAGAIDLRSRAIPRDPHGALELGLGSNLFGRLHVWGGASNAWGGLLAEGVFLRSDGFKHIVGAPDERSGTGFDRAEVVVRGELREAVSSDVYQRLELRLGIAAEGSSETYVGLTDADFRQDPWQRYAATQLDRMQWWRTQIQLRHTLEVGDGFVLRTAAYRHDFDRAWLKVNGMSGASLFDVLTTPSGRNTVLAGVLRGEVDSEGGGAGDLLRIGTNARRFGVTGLQTEGTGTAVTGPLSHRVRIGARLHHDAVERHHTEDEYAMLDGQLDRRSAETATTLRTHAESLALSLHAAYSLTLFDAVTFTPGVRAELIWTRYDDLRAGLSSRAFRAAVLPGATVAWQVESHLSVFAGVMRGFAPVAPGQAETVQAEDSVSYEAGARFTHQPTQTSALLTGFVSDYSNYLQQCSFSAGCSDVDIDAQANGGRPIVGGVDVRISTKPHIGDVHIPLRLSYTYTYTELRDAIGRSPNPLFLNAQPGDHLPYIPEHQLGVQAGVESEPFGVNVSATFVSEMWEGAGQGESTRVPRTDAYFLLDATMYVQVFEELRLYVRGENLTFTQAVAARRPLGARPVRPFQLQGGLRFEM